uniref:Slc22a-2 n=1 Tax=Schmidtea mediterranea TaxID=79327 RepID=A0A0H3YF32_SCHMD|nr:slc22a-2 [Schmidtea mediterranea]
MDYEHLNAKIGGCGLFHYISFMTLSITTFKYVVEFQGLTFALYEPKFSCLVKNISSTIRNSTNLISKDQCQYRLSVNDSWNKCDQWTFEKRFMRNTLINELNLVCDRAFYRELIFTTFFVGCLFSFPFSILSDSIGKRLLLIVSIFLSTIITIGQMVSYQIWQQLVLSFVSGVCKSVYVSLAYTTLIEIIPVSHIDLAATNFWNLYSFGYMSVALFAYIFRSWRQIYILSLITSIFYVLYFWFVPETPRWLMLNKRRNEAFKTMSFIAKINKCTLNKEEFNKWKPIQQVTGKFWNLLKHKTMIYRFLILNFAGWAFSFAYIGSATDLTFASENIFITTFVMGLVELPTGPLSGIMANKLGRKKSVSALSGLGIICLIIMPFIEADSLKSVWQPWLKVCLAMGAKLGFSSAWLIFDIITNELIPTTDRNTAMSLVYITVGLGSIFAPMIHSVLLQFYFAGPFLLYSLLLLITVVLVFAFIPETHHLPVPQTIEQAVSLLIHKEQEWKMDMIQQAEKLGMVHRPSKQLDTEFDKFLL